jgi:hypothetical protein
MLQLHQAGFGLTVDRVRLAVLCAANDAAALPSWARSRMVPVRVEALPFETSLDLVLRSGRIPDSAATRAFAKLAWKKHGNKANGAGPSLRATATVCRLGAKLANSNTPPDLVEDSLRAILQEGER